MKAASESFREGMVCASHVSSFLDWSLLRSYVKGINRRAWLCWYPDPMYKRSTALEGKIEHCLFKNSNILSEDSSSKATTISWWVDSTNK